MTNESRIDVCSVKLGQAHYTRPELMGPFMVPGSYLSARYHYSERVVLGRMLRSSLWRVAAGQLPLKPVIDIWSVQ